MRTPLLNVLPRSLWNYNPDNTDQEGDNWNGENFSWFSQCRAMPKFPLDHEQTSLRLDGGGRILDAVIRPYPAKVAGIPLAFNYEMMNGEMSFSWMTPQETEHDRLCAHETEIFFPSFLVSGRKLLLEARVDTSQYKCDDQSEFVKKLQVLTEERYAYTYDECRQTLFVIPKDTSAGIKHDIRVRVWPPIQPVFSLNDFWSDFGVWIGVVVSVLVAILVAIVISIVSVWIGYD